MLKFLNRAIARFCHKHRRFGIPRLMMFVVFISAVVFLIDMMDTTGLFLRLLDFNADRVMSGEIWRLITWIFLPVSGNFIFAALALYFYYFIGATLEREWETPKFTIYYILGIALNLILGFVSRYVFHIYASLTSNYINLSMFFAFAVLFPDFVVRLFFIIPIKVKWLALINAAFFAYSIVFGIIVGQIFLALLPLIALLNFFIICGEDLIGYIRPYKSRVSTRTIRFRTAVRREERNKNNQAFRHKCSVCGKTDVDYPDLQFRYCSRCNGYHCFCVDHINSHIHFQ